MSSAHDAREAYDEIFLREVARLLPDVNIIRLRSGGPEPQHAADAVTDQSLSTAAQSAARHLVDAWSAVFAGSEHPESLNLGWSSFGAPDVVHAQVAARLVAETARHPNADVRIADVPDPEAAAAGLRQIGWSTAIRSKSSGGFNVLGQLDGFRLDVVVQVEAGLRAARVSGPAIVAGELAPRLTEAASREIRWPPTR